MSIIFCLAIILPDLSFAVTRPSNSALAPSLATDDILSKSFRDKWSFTAISFHIIFALTRKISKYTVSKHIREYRENVMDEVGRFFPEGFDIGQVEEKRDEYKGLKSFRLPITHNGKVKYIYHYELEGEAQDLSPVRLEGDTKVFVRVEKVDDKSSDSKSPDSSDASSMLRRKPPPPGNPATLLKYMCENKIFEEGRKTAKEMKRQRGGKDSLTNVRRELRILIDMRIVKKWGQKYYLIDLFKDIDPDKFIKNNPELVETKPTPQEKDVVRDRVIWFHREYKNPLIMAHKILRRISREFNRKHAGKKAIQLNVNQAMQYLKGYISRQGLLQKRTHIENVNAYLEKAFIRGKRPSVSKDSPYYQLAHIAKRLKKKGLNNIQIKTGEHGRLRGSRGSEGLPNDVYTPELKEAIDSYNILPIVYDGKVAKPAEFFFHEKRGEILTKDLNLIKPNLSYLNGAIRKLSDEDRELLAKVQLVFFDGEREAHYSLSRPQIFINIRYVTNVNELIRLIHHELQEREYVILGMDKFENNWRKKRHAPDIASEISRLAEKKHRDLFQDGASDAEKKILLNLPEYKDEVFRPKSLMIGPGMCSLGCRFCHQGGVLNDYLLKNREKFKLMLRGADKAGITEYVWNIGEPFYDTEFIYEMLGVMGHFKNVEIIGFVTNAEFAKTEDEAAEILGMVRDVVDRQDDEAFSFGLTFSWDKEHRARGITSQHIINLLRGVRREWGEGLVKIQIVKLPGDNSKEDLFRDLQGEGLISLKSDMKSLLKSRRIDLTNGIILDVMNIDTSLPEGTAEGMTAGEDYFLENSSKGHIIANERGIDVLGHNYSVDGPRFSRDDQALALGPDGNLYLDDKFGDRKSIPLSHMTDINGAIGKVNQHPILRTLVTKGVSHCFDVYDNIPEDRRSVQDIYELALSHPLEVSLLASGCLIENKDVREELLRAMIYEDVYLGNLDIGLADEEKKAIDAARKDLRFDDDGNISLRGIDDRDIEQRSIGIHLLRKDVIEALYSEDKDVEAFEWIAYAYFGVLLAERGFGGEVDNEVWKHIEGICLKYLLSRTLWGNPKRLVLAKLLEIFGEENPEFWIRYKRLFDYTTEFYTNHFNGSDSRGSEGLPNEACNLDIRNAISALNIYPVIYDGTTAKPADSFYHEVRGEIKKKDFRLIRPNLTYLDGAIRKLSDEDRGLLKGIKIIFFEGEREAHYGVSRPQIYINIRYISNSDELVRLLHHELQERDYVIRNMDAYDEDWRTRRGDVEIEKQIRLLAEKRHFELKRKEKGQSSEHPDRFSTAKGIRSQFPLSRFRRGTKHLKSVNGLRTETMDFDPGIAVDLEQDIRSGFRTAHGLSDGPVSAGDAGTPGYNGESIHALREGFALALGRKLFRKICAKIEDVEHDGRLGDLLALDSPTPEAILETLGYMALPGITRHEQSKIKRASKTQIPGLISAVHAQMASKIGTAIFDIEAWYFSVFKKRVEDVDAKSGKKKLYVEDINTLIDIVNELPEGEAINRLDKGPGTKVSEDNWKGILKTMFHYLLSNGLLFIPTPIAGSDFAVGVVDSIEERFSPAVPENIYKIYVVREIDNRGAIGEGFAVHTGEIVFMLPAPETMDIVNNTYRQAWEKRQKSPGGGFHVRFNPAQLKGYDPVNPLLKMWVEVNKYQGAAGKDAIAKDKDCLLTEEMLHQDLFKYLKSVGIDPQNMRSNVETSRKIIQSLVKDPGLVEEFENISREEDKIEYAMALMEGEGTLGTMIHSGYPAVVMYEILRQVVFKESPGDPEGPEYPMMRKILLRALSQRILGAETDFIHGNAVAAKQLWHEYISEEGTLTEEVIDITTWQANIKSAAEEAYSKMFYTTDERRARVKEYEKAKEQEVPETITPETEERYAYLLRDILKTTDGQRKENEPLILALGTSWIKGYAEEGRNFQHGLINPLLSALRSFCREHNIIFIYKPDEALEGAVAEARRDIGREDAKAVVLAEKKTAKKLYSLENFFVVGIDAVNLNNTSYYPIIDMITLALNFNYGLNMHAESPNIIIDKDSEPFIIFIPRIQRIEWKEIDLDKIYEAQRSA